MSMYLTCVPWCLWCLPVFERSSIMMHYMVDIYKALSQSLCQGAHRHNFLYICQHLECGLQDLYIKICILCNDTDLFLKSTLHMLSLSRSVFRGRLPSLILLAFSLLTFRCFVQPPPVNCTEDPTNPVCGSQPPAQPPLGPVPEPTAQPPNTPAQTPGFSILPVPPAQTPGPSTLPIGVPPSGNPTQTPGVSTLPIGVPPSNNPTQTPGVSTLPLVPPPVYVNPIRTPPTFGNGGNSQPPSQFNQSGRRMKV